MKIGILGAGSMGRTHAQSWAQTPAHVVGVSARTPASAEKLANDSGARPFVSLAAMLPHVDVVDICTPTDVHLEQALAAFAAGKHVVCEKPIARTLDEAGAMIVAAQRSGKQLLVAHVLRYFEQYANARQRAIKGEIGKVREVFLARRGTLPDAGVRGWFADEARSGGVALDLMIHDFDYARWLCGDVKTVRAERLSPLAVNAQLTHANGIVSHIEGRWDSPAFLTEASIFGTSDVIEFDNGVRDSYDPYVAQARDLYAALSDATQPRVTAADGLEALRIALAVLESAKTGNPVSL